MKKPVGVNADLRRKTSRLFFEGEKSGHEYYMRGGVCWPTSYEVEGVSQIGGFALLAGQDVNTKIIRVFEQIEFLCVDHILEDSRIRYEGVAPWFTMCWSKYFVNKFFWHQDHALMKTYRLELIRSAMATPKPTMVEIDWADDEAARHIIWKNVMTNRLKVEEESVLHQQIELARAEKGLLPAVHALQCCLAGLERHPWREPRRRQ